MGVDESMIDMKNISIRNRMLTIFLVWIILFIGFGVFAISEIKLLKEVTTDLYEYSLKLSDIQSQIHVDIIKIQRNTRDIVLAEGTLEIQEKVEEINQLEKNINENLDRIMTQAKSEEELQIKADIRNTVTEWKRSRSQVIAFITNQQHGEAIKIMTTLNKNYVDRIEGSLKALSVYEANKASQLMLQADNIERAHIRTLGFLMMLFPLVGMILFFLVMRSILNPIASLKEIMYKSTHSNEMTEYSLEGKNEITDLANHYNLLIKKLKEQFWIKDGQNQLSEELQGNLSLKDFTQKVINHLSRFMDAGKGAFYLYDGNKKALCLDAAYAITKKDQLSGTYPLGYGVVGQVALEKKSILLKNIGKGNSIIETGTHKEAPLNTYTFPLIYENEIYGVIELASFEAFTDLKEKFICEVSPKIAVNLYAAIQNNRVKELLRITEMAQVEAQETAEKLRKANMELEENHKLLHQQSSELQENNAQLEEQQQLLEEKSYELQQSNLELEGKQRQLEEQSRLLGIQNKHLEVSKEELTKQTEELEKSSKYKSEFLANVSHELRTPLNAIILLSKIILNNSNNQLKEEDLEKLNIIYNSGNELLRLINDILDISKIESGRFDLEVVEFSSEELIQELRQMFKEIADEKGIEFIAEDLIKTRIEGDKNKISQILRNFLSNAFKFTEEGRITLQISRDEKEKDTILFSVEDTGRGISNDKQELVFEEFKQIDGSISRKYGGTGLGLSIAKKLANLLGGEIQLISKEGVGSNFILRLKNLPTMANDEDKNDEEVYFEIIRTGISEISASMNGDIEGDEVLTSQIKSINEYGDFNDIDELTTLDLKDKKILIVDDDPRNIFVLATALENHGAIIYDAENGEVALKRLNEFIPDLILMDIMMPRMDGYETIKSIRQDKRFKDTPIIALTAKTLKEDRIHCIKAGANDYISKPVEYDTLIHLVKAWIEKQL